MRPQVGKNWLVYLRDFFNPRAESKAFERIEFLSWSTFSQEATALYSTALSPVLKQPSKATQVFWARVLRDYPLPSL